MLFAILAAWFGYKRAKQTGRNGFLWGFIAAGVFIGTQLLIALGIGILLAFGVEIWGWSETVYDDYNAVVTVISIVTSFISLFFVFRYLDKVSEQPSINEPPSPPTFDEKL